MYTQLIIILYYIINRTRHKYQLTRLRCVCARIGMEIKKKILRVEICIGFIMCMFFLQPIKPLRLRSRVSLI